MSLRFRKSKSLGKGVKLNLFKKSAGISFGGRGARVGVGRRGLYTSGGIPGSGLYGISYMGSGKKGRASKSGDDEPHTAEDYQSVVTGCLGVVVGVTVFVLMFTNPGMSILIGLAAVGIYLLYRNTPTQKVQRYTKQAVDLIENDQPEGGIKLLREAKRIDPRNERTTYLLGAVLHNEGRFKEAIPLLNEILKRNKDNYYVKLLTANAYYRTGDYDNAISLLQSIPEEIENYIKVISILGACFYEKEQYQVAVEVLQRAPLSKRKLDDDLMEIHYNLAASYEKLGDKKNALRHYKRVYSNDVNYLDVKKKVENNE